MAIAAQFYMDEETTVQIDSYHAIYLGGVGSGGLRLSGEPDDLMRLSRALQMSAQRQRAGAPKGVAELVTVNNSKD